MLRLLKWHTSSAESYRLAAMAAEVKAHRPRIVGVDGAGELISDASPAVYQFQRLAEVSPAVRANDDALAREIMRLSEAS